MEFPLEQEGLYSLQDELKGLAVVSATIERLGIIQGELKNGLRAFQREVRLQKVRGIAQSVITDQFRCL